MKVMTKKLLVGFVFVFVSWAYGDKPAVIWKSEPVNPGEAVMVFGGPWSSNSVVELAGREKVAPICVTDDTLTFVYPQNWPLSEFSAKISDGSGSVTTSINEADVWWIQGDKGGSSTPGGWLRVFGRSIGYSDKAFIELRGTKKIKLTAAASDLYNMLIEIPADIALGDYEVFVNNGLNGKAVSAGKLHVVAKKEFWKSKVFNVEDYGAIANDRNDDSRAILAALDALKANGGGILYFPRGRFGMTGELVLPPHTLLRGAGMALSQIYWIDEDDPHDALVSGSHDFGLEEIFLASGNFHVGIQADVPGTDDIWKSENILLHKVRTRFLDTDSLGAEEKARRRSTPAHQVTMRGSSNVRILDCDFYTTKGGMSVLALHNSLVRGNRFSGARTGAYIGGRQVIFEGNDCRGFTLSFGNGSRNYYFARNQLGDVRGDGDRETFTFDGGRTAYNGTVAAVRKQGLTLPPGAWRDGAKRWIGETVCVIGGKGAGQTRLVSSIEGRDVELDEAWDIEPDTNSYIVVGLERQNLLLLDNNLGDGNPFQLYGSAINVVMAGNRIEGNSMHAFGMSKGGSPEPSWFIQFFDNHILEGNTVRGPWSYMVPAADSYIGFFDRGIVKPLTYPQNRVGIMRRNVLNSNAFLYAGPKVENMLVENNVVRHADKGVVVKSKGAIVRGNSFKDVNVPYSVSDDTLLAPSERLAAALGAVEVLVPDLPGEWSKLKDAADALPPTASTEAVRGLLLKAVRSLSASLGDTPAPAKLVGVLLGLDLQQSSQWLLARIGSGSLKKGQYPVGSKYPEWSLPATLSATPGPLGDWTARVKTPKKVIPGSRATVKLCLSRPDDAPTVLDLPVDYVLTGDGWKLQFSETYTWNKLPVTQFLVAGPFKNASGMDIDTEVHPPEINLDVTQSYNTLDGKRPWVPVKPDAKGKVTLASVFQHTEMATAHVVAVIRAKRPLRVYVAYGRNTSNLAFVNGTRIGSSARRPGPALAVLKAGDNLFHLITSNGSGNWPINVKLTVLDPVQPGDLAVLSVDALPGSALLAPKGNKIQEGRQLPNSLGVDWKLVYSDNFDRMRLGSGWSCNSPGWMPQTAIIAEHALKVGAGWGFLTWKTPVMGPVRIEADVTFKGYMVGAYRCPKGLAWRSFWGRGGKGEGCGYCLSLGWHDAKNNRILRDIETAVLDQKGPVPKDGDTFHMTAQFVPPRCELYVDGKLIMEYEDPKPLTGLDRVGLFSFSDSTFDNVRIYKKQ